MAELQSGLEASMAAPERCISMGRKSAWVIFFLGLLMFCWGAGNLCTKNVNNSPIYNL